MIGNVWEWVQDCYADKYGEGIRSGSAFEKPNCRSRVRRGGSWSYDPRIARAANRSGNGPASRSVSLGFRVCRGAPIE